MKCFPWVDVSPQRARAQCTDVTFDYLDSFLKLRERYPIDHAKLAQFVHNPSHFLTGGLGGSCDCMMDELVDSDSDTEWEDDDFPY